MRSHVSLYKKRQKKRNGKKGAGVQGDRKRRKTQKGKALGRQCREATTRQGMLTAT